MNPGKLFYRRLRENWSFQYGVIRSAVDWTVALYIVIPALAVGGYHYVSWLRAAPEWMERIPYGAAVAVLLLVALSGGIRLFVEEADQLFLTQRERWIRGVRWRGLLYSAVCHVVHGALAVALLAPLLSAHRLPWALLVLLGGLTGSVRFACAVAGYRISCRHVGWRRYGAVTAQIVLFSAVFLAGAVGLTGVPPLAGRTLPVAPRPGWVGAVLLFAMIALLLAGGIRMARRLAAVKWTFLHDADHERKQRLRLAALMLAQVTDIRPRRPRRGGPLLFRRSAPLFRRRTAANTLAETCVKSFVRDRLQRSTYVRLVFFGFAAILLVPPWLMPFIGLSVALLLGTWTRSYWKQMVKAPYLQMFPWRDADKRAAAGKALYVLMLPGCLLLGLAAGFGSGSWLGALAAIPAGWAAAYAIAHFFASW